MYYVTTMEASERPDDVSLTYNGTDTVAYPAFYLLSISLIAVVTIVGNTLVLVVFLSRAELRVPANYFIISLAFSDLIQGMTYTCYNISHLYDIQNGSLTSCITLVIFFFAPMMTSGYSLVGVTVVRFLVVKRPLTYKQDLTKPIMMSAVVVMWILGWAIAIALNGTGGTKEMSSTNETLSLVETLSPAWQKGFCRFELIYSFGRMIGLLVLPIVVPLFLMSVIYACTIVLYRRKTREMVERMQSVSASEAACLRNSKRERKLTRVAAMLVGYFAFSWIPLLIVMFYNMACGDCVNQYVRASARILEFTNTSVNVFVYAGQYADFRKACSQMLRCRVKTPKKDPQQNSSEVIPMNTDSSAA